MDLFDPGVVENPYPFFEQLLLHAPVYQVPETRVFLVASWALIHQVLKNQRDYSANLTGLLLMGENGCPTVFDMTSFGGKVDALANADEPVHALHRKLVLPYLNSRSVTALEDDVRTWVGERLAPFIRAGGGDAVRDLADPIPVMVTARLLGLPLQDSDTLLQWAFAGGDILAGTINLQRMMELSASTGAMAEYLGEAFDRRASEGHSGPPRQVMDALVSGVASGQISREDAVSILIVLVGAAGESTSSLLGSAIRLLAETPALQQRLREDDALIGGFLEEVVRLEASFKGHYRVVLRETQLGGSALSPGDRVFLLWAAANRDPAVFEQPNELCIGRADAGEHLGFGHGIHFCVGARLARMEARIVLQELLRASRSFKLSEPDGVRHISSIFVRRLTSLALSVAAR